MLAPYIMHYVEMSDLQKLIALLFLKSAPQDLPFAKAFAVRLSFLYWFTGVLVLSTTLRPGLEVQSMGLSLVILLGFVYIVLRAFNLEARFVQTVSAMAGVSLLFNLVSWPLLYVVAANTGGESTLALVSLFFLMLISWEILVKAHIFKHALELSMFKAMILSFSLFFITMTLSQLLFPSAVAS